MVWNVRNPRCCVYAIRCTADGKVYVGSTTNLVVRWSQHKTDLRGDNHGNKHLQAAWNRYGAGAFRMAVLEDVADEGLLHEREQHWIDTLYAADPDRGFNLALVAGKSFARGLTVPPEKRAHYARTSARTYVLTDPEGVEHVVTNLKQFCKDRGLCVWSMRHAMTGKCRNHHRGWMCRKADTTPEEWKARLEAMGRTTTKTFEVTSPEGRLYVVRKLVPFCREHQLSVSAIRMVMDGKQSHHRGWTCRKMLSEVCVPGGYVQPPPVEQPPPQAAEKPRQISFDFGD